MVCSQCGAPLDAPAGTNAVCHYCGQAQTSDAPRVSAAAPMQIRIVGPGEDEPESVDTGYRAPITQRPPAGASALGKIIMVAAIVIVAGVVLSIFAGATATSRARQHRDHPHHRQ